MFDVPASETRLDASLSADCGASCPITAGGVAYSPMASAQPRAVSEVRRLVITMPRLRCGDVRVSRPLKGNGCAEACSCGFLRVWAELPSEAMGRDAEYF